MRGLSAQENAMALTFYGSEFIVNGVSNDDYAGAATGLTAGLS
jgi:hypothetical protein